MDYDDIEALRRDPAWRLLRSPNAALLLSFLGRVFVDDNVREISAGELAELLDDELYALNERIGEASFPRRARDYLDEWAGTDAGWLRKYYAPGKDEPQFDALPAVEQAVDFVRGLERREFIGTESRLNTVFDLLRQIVFGAENDPDKRLAELHRQRAQLDAQIAEVERGELTYLDTAAVRDRFQQFSATARELLADFRQVEANFRGLDHDLRAQIAAWTGTKGELLDEVLADRGDISRSEQGRTFSAFYDFLLSPRRQAEFQELLGTVTALDALAADVDPRTRRVHYDWLAAAERTQDTVRLLSEQLRRFLDDAVWLENRRIVEILDSVRARALQLRDRESELPGAELDAFAPEIVLPLERRLYEVRQRTAIDSEPADPDSAGADPSALFEQTHVDVEALSRNVHDALGGRVQVGLAEVVDAHPLGEGLAELLSYLTLPDEQVAVVFDESSTEQLDWIGADDVERSATVPKVSFVQRRAVGGAR